MSAITGVEGHYRRLAVDFLSHASYTQVRREFGTCVLTSTLSILADWTLGAYAMAIDFLRRPRRPESFYPVVEPLQ